MQRLITLAVAVLALPLLGAPSIPNHKLVSKPTAPLAKAPEAKPKPTIMNKSVPTTQPTPETKAQPKPSIVNN